jgi:gliding motility-associated-like protein
MQFSHFVLYFTFLLCHFPFQVNGQNNTFYRKYNLPGMQGALQMEVTADGGFIATGQHEGNGSHGDCDIYAYKLDVCGNIDWFKIYGTTGQEGGKSIIELNDGNFLVSGLYAGSGNNRAFNMKVDANGNMLWLRRYGFEWMMYAKEAQNGDFLSIGRNGGSLFVIRTNNNGILIWSKQLLNLGDMGLFLDELPNNDIIVTSVKGSFGKDVAAARLDSQGNLIWSKVYGGTGWSDVDHSTWSCKAAVNIDDNSMVITSPTLMGVMTDENMLVSKISLVDGSVIWAKAFGGSGRDQSRDITKFPGGYAIVGHTNSFPTPVNQAQGIYEALGEKDILLFAIDENGELLWARTYGGASRDKGVGVKYNLDNGFSISAFTSSDYFGNTDASFDPLFIKTDSVGVVGCQMSSPPLNQVAINLQAFVGGSVQNVTISNDAPPISSINYSPNDQYQCQSCSSVPLFSLSDTTVCVNDPVYLTNTTIVGLTCFQEWNIDGVTYQGDINPTITFSEAGTYSIYLYSTCGLNSDTIIKTIYVLDPTIDMPAYLCENAPDVQLTASEPNGIWSGQNVGSNGMFTPQNLNAGFHPVLYDIPQYCAIEDSIEIRALPPLTIDPDTSFCILADHLIEATNAAQYTYAWSPGTNLNQTNVYNPQFTFTNIGLATEEFTYTLTVTDQLSSCSATDSIHLLVFPEPPVVAGNDTLLCDGDLYHLEAFGAVQYSWSNGNTNDTDILLPIGMHTIWVTGTDANSCVHSDTLTIEIVENPIVNAGPDTLVCIGNSLLLTGTSPDADSFAWNTGTVNGQPYQAPAIGTFPMILTGTNIHSCSTIDTFLLEVHPLPVANFSFTVDCYSPVVNFTNGSSVDPIFAENLSFTWYANNQSFSNASIATSFDNQSPGNLNIALVAVSSPGNCADSISVPIEIPTNPVIAFSYVQDCEYLLRFEGEVPANEQVVSSQWTYNGQSFGMNQSEPTLVLPGSGLYTISYIITNDYPCTYTATQEINIIPDETLGDQIIPNVITPNNDGINDEISFDMFIHECIDYEVYILNRWGNVVFKSSRNNSPFKGDDEDNQPLVQGVYFYKLLWNGDVRHGNITIIR